MTDVAKVDGSKAISLADIKIDTEVLDSMRGGNTGVKAKTNLPQLGIFHTTPRGDCKHPNGTWLVGQQKGKEGATKGHIVDQGKKAVCFTPLSVRKQYNYYNDKDIDNKCSSNLFMDFTETITGGAHKFACGKKKEACEFVMKKDKGCKCQIVLIGIAELEDGKEVLVRYYARGASYFPVQKILDDGYTLSLGGNTHTLECFMAPFDLGVGPEQQNGNVIYFEPDLAITKVHPQTRWPQLKKDSDRATQLLMQMGPQGAGSSKPAQGGHVVEEEPLVAEKEKTEPLIPDVVDDKEVLSSELSDAAGTASEEGAPQDLMDELTSIFAADKE